VTWGAVTWGAPAELVSRELDGGAPPPEAQPHE